MTVTGVASGDNYLYSFSYNNASYDGDAINDTLSFDILVQAWSGGTISSTTSSANGTGNQFTDGVATIGTTTEQVALAGDAFSVGNVMGIGNTVQFTLQNFSVTTSDAGAPSNVASLLGFTGFENIETGASFGHQTILGAGTGLQGVAWNVTHTYDFASITGAGDFYVSSGSTPSGSNPQRWRFSDLDFTVAVVPEPSSYALLAGLLGLSAVMLRRRQA